MNTYAKGFGFQLLSGEIIFISPKSFLIFKVFLETILRKITNFTLDQNYSYDYFF